MDRLSSALKYSRRGFSVLPTDGKRPLIKFADQPPLTAEEIEYYWTKWPDANIALRTLTLFVVDIDTKQAHGADGVASAKQLMKAGALVPTAEQQTASGGRQLFYQKPAGQQIKQVIGFRPGIDIKAHKNNYVLVPPSTTSEGQYEWMTDSTRDIRLPSQLLLDLLRQQPVIKAPLNGVAHPQTAKLWTGMVLDNIVNGAPQGQRNDHLTRLCGQMIHAEADDETVWELLNFANSFNDPPLAANEVCIIMESILKRELRH